MLTRFLGGRRHVSAMTSELRSDRTYPDIMLSLYFGALESVTAFAGLMPAPTPAAVRTSGVFATSSLERVGNETRQL